MGVSEDAVYPQHFLLIGRMMYTILRQTQIKHQLWFYLEQFL